MLLIIFFRISKLEYVGIIIDVLKLRKNICISRHFQGLNKSSLFRPDRASIFGTKSRKKLYLDVWLVDFFSPSLTDVTDTTRSYHFSHFTYFRMFNFCGTLIEPSSSMLINSSLTGYNFEMIFSSIIAQSVID